MRPAWILPLLLAACGTAPLSNPGPRADIAIGQADAPETAADVVLDADIDSAPATAAAPTGLRALFRTPATATSDTPPAAATGPAPEAGAPPAADTAPRPGLFARLVAAPDAGPSDAREDDVPRTAAATAPRPAAQSRPQTGLFGTPRANRTTDEAPPGSVLPFGRVARVCSASKRDLGQEVDRTGSWRLYDTIPNSSAARVMYLGGSDDKCSQMFTAALVLFGSPVAHEAVRYSMRGSYSETDEAYEKIKGRICGVRRGASCPSDRIGKLEKQVTFVTAYPSFGSTSGPWLEILLHNGDVVASALTQR